MVGSRIKHYEILEKLGEGGMGVVYLAEDTRLGRQVAIKFLPPQASDTEADKQRFEQEARAAARLNHPHICTIYSFDEHEARPFLVMEYVEGTTLRERVREGPLPVEEALDYGVQIARALAEAHEAGITHRDIKPANIMVDTKGRVKVMDFGLAKLKGTDAITRTGSTVGTMAYMAPEQIRGEEVDHRTDIFAFGVVLFEMLAGIRPFRGEHEAALMYSIVNEDAALLRSYLPEAPDVLVEIFDRSLAKEPDARFSSAADLGDALQDVKETTGVSALSAQPVRAESTSSLASGRGSGGSSTTLSITLPGGGSWEISLGGMSVVVGTTCMLAIAIVVGWWMWPTSTVMQGSDSTLEVEQVQFSDLVAVMAFEDRTGDASLEHVGMMAADWIAQGLQRTELVRVVPPETAVQLVSYGAEREERDDGLDARALADRAGAGTVITGAVYRRGDDLEIHTRLIDVRTATQVAVLDPIRGSAEDPMEVVDAVRQRVMSLVAAQFDEELDFLIMLDEVPKYEAYRDYVEGLRLFVGWQDFEAAMPYFRRAYERDPAFLQPLMFKAYSVLNLGDVVRADSLFERLEEESVGSTRQMRALSDLGLATTKGHLERAYRAGREAHDLIPGNYAVIYMAGYGAKRVNRPREAVEVLRQADPEVRVGGDGPAAGNWIPYWIVLAGSLHMTEQYADEFEQVGRAETYHPETFRLVEAKARALVGMDRLDDLDGLLQQYERLREDGHGGTYGGLLRLVGRELRAHGFDRESQAVLERALSWYEEQSGENFPEPFTYGVAQTLYELGRWGEAAALFGQLADENPNSLEFGGFLGVAAAMMGDRALAEEIDQSLAALEHPYLLGLETQWRARIAAALGEESRAISLLEQAISEGLPFGTWLHVDKVLSTLADNPEYQELVAVRG